MNCRGQKAEERTLPLLSLEVILNIPLGYCILKKDNTNTIKYVFLLFNFLFLKLLHL